MELLSFSTRGDSRGKVYRRLGNVWSPNRGRTKKGPTTVSQDGRMISSNAQSVDPLNDIERHEENAVAALVGILASLLICRAFSRLEISPRRSLGGESSVC